MESDRAPLEKLFRELLFTQGFAYTLFGDKPVSTDCFSKEATLDHSFCPGYEIWQKYAHSFSQEVYIFLFYEDEAEGRREITLINKAAFLKIIGQHRRRFASLFGKDVTPTQILQLVTERGSLWNTALKNREDLIGLLLGYGQRNPELFHKRKELKGEMGLRRKRATPSPGFGSAEEELKFLETHLTSFSKERARPLRLMRLPSFAADLSLVETQVLLDKYQKLREQITPLFSEGRVIDVVLKSLNTVPSLDLFQ